jgi:hypothetical protein
MYSQGDFQHVLDVKFSKHRSLLGYMIFAVSSVLGGGGVLFGDQNHGSSKPLYDWFDDLFVFCDGYGCSGVGNESS